MLLRKNNVLALYPGKPALTYHVDFLMGAEYELLGSKNKAKSQATTVRIKVDAPWQ